MIAWGGGFTGDGSEMIACGGGPTEFGKNDVQRLGKIKRDDRRPSLFVYNL